jgi:NAD(P)-dependent dehydrogenase (short-subunit alcohol dehydrogenase family)
MKRTRDVVLISGSTSELSMGVIQKLKKKNNLILLYKNKRKIKTYIRTSNIILIKTNSNPNFYLSLIRTLKKKKLKPSAILHFNGVHSFSTLKSMSLDEFNKIYQINCYSFIQMVKLAIDPDVSSNLKSIVTISSVSSKRGNKAGALYSSSKSALDNIVKSFALELSKKKIRVNSIVLGHISKGMGENIKNFLNERQLEDLKNQHPLGFGEIDDLYHSIEFLITKKSRWITGTNFILDGGYLI